MSPLRWFAAGTLAVLVGSVAYFGIRIADYLGSPYVINSNAGMVVFERNGRLASYPPFSVGIESWMLGFGLALLVAAVFLAAVLWRPRVR